MIMEYSKCIDIGRSVFSGEMIALTSVQNCLGDEFVHIARMIDACKGKVLFVGMGKPGRVNGKVAATFCSLGIPSIVLHPGESMHGDLGVVQENDLAIVVSYSGESDEIVSILPSLKRYSNGLVAVTGNPDSTLAKYADVVQVLPPFEEADPLGLAPTSSTTVWLVYADALAVTVSKSRGFTKEDFGARHPAGSLGKKLIYNVDDLMARESNNAVVPAGSSLTAAIIQIGEKGIGMTCVVRNGNELAGVITDGDLRRLLQRGVDVYECTVEHAMSAEPITIAAGTKAIDALRLMREKNVSCLPVLDGGNVVGTIQLQAIVDAGIIL